MPLAAFPHRTFALAQSDSEACSRVFEDRGGTEKQACGQRHCEREQCDASIYADFIQARQSLWRQSDQNPQGSVSQSEAKQTAAYRQNQTLKQQLRSDTAPARSQRGADGQLLPAPLSAY